MVCCQYMTWYYEELYRSTKDIVKCYSNYIPFSSLTILESPSDVGKYIKQKVNATELYLEHSQCMVT
jgi:hypothetical protein